MMTNWPDRISAFVKGPGWFPGTSRLGDLEMVPEVKTKKMINLQFCPSIIPGTLNPKKQQSLEGICWLMLFYSGNEERS